MRTFLFTDIEGSTRLWDEHGDDMAAALARHDEILDAAVGGAGGSVLKSTGDGLIGVFDSLAGGVSAAIDGQRALASEQWGMTGPLLVRMGIHGGDTERRQGDFFGPVMNRAARIMAAGHGGQILVSAIAASGTDLPFGVDLRDLGLHRLKDLTEPEHLYQVVHDGLRADFPPLNTLDGRRHNLPQQMTELVGRDEELATIRLMLDTATTRLLTLAGPGGVGKTRIALQIAADELDRYPDGAYFVDLSTVRDPDAVFDAIAATLDISLSGAGDALRTIETRLRDSRMMLVLDNFEQVTAAASDLSRLLQHAPGIDALVTSRETLRVRGEKVFPVPPLALPHPQDHSSVVAESAAVRLFTDRARVVRPDFAITGDNAAAVAEICLRLDGLPLAIELAAARLNVFTPTDLLGRLRQRLDVLGAGGRDLPDRQRTLWGAIGWSYELLDRAERDVFEVLSAFSTVELGALEAVASEVLGPVDAVDTLGSLVDKSLVRAVDSQGPQRFSMLLMISEFAALKLSESPDRLAAVREAHARHYSGLVRDLGDRLWGAERREALAGLEIELGNLTAAWDHWVDRGDGERLLDMIDGMWALHETRGWYRAAMDLATDALGVLEREDRASDLAAERLVIRMGLARATMAVHGYGVEAEDAFRRALDVSETVGTPADRFPVLRALSTYYMGVSDFAAAVGYGSQLLELGEEANDDSIRIEGHYVFGAASVFAGDKATGLPHLDRAIALHDPKVHGSGRFRLGPNTGVVARVSSGLILWGCGAMDEAVARLEAAIEVARTIDHPYSIAFALHHNGLLAVYRGRFEEARRWARELATVSEDNDYQVWRTLATVFEGIASTFLGDIETGPAMTERGIELYRGLTAPPVFWPQLLTFRAQVCAVSGEPERGLELVDEAIGFEPAYQPDFRLARGDILKILADLEGAEQSYRAACQDARAAELHGVELVALTRLTALCRQMGRTPDGSEELAARYATFTEGFDELPMVEARRLLEAGAGHA